MTHPRLQAGPSIWLIALIATLPLACHAGIQVGAQPTLSVTLHEPVIAPLVLWNVSPAAVEIETGQGSELSYGVTVTRPNGGVVKPGGPLWAQAPDTMTAMQPTRIGPSQSYTRPLLLNEWFPFDEVGRYAVSVALPGVEGAAYFEVDVSPRDETRLVSTCARLTADASKSLSDNQLFAARALSPIADDVAIPYLVRIASIIDLGSGGGVDGLVRIGDLQAVSALASLLRQGDPFVRRKSEAALVRLRGATLSEPVRQAIAAALPVE
jgi:hypothetical protein